MQGHIKVPPPKGPPITEEKFYPERGRGDTIAGCYSKERAKHRRDEDEHDRSVRKKRRKKTIATPIPLRKFKNVSASTKRVTEKKMAKIMLRRGTR